MSDYIAALRQDLVEAAERERQHSPARRVARPLLPRSWSPLALLGTGAAVAGLLLLVVTLRAVSPPRTPEAPKVVGTYHLGSHPRDAAAAAGSLMIADYYGTVVRRSPASPQNPRQFKVRGQPTSIAADGDTIWVTTVAPLKDLNGSYLVQLDARTGQRLARVPLEGYASQVAVGAGGVWFAADLHSGGLARVDRRTRKRTAFVPKIAVEGLAVAGDSVWVRAGETVTQRDERGQVVHHVKGISGTLGEESQRTLLADAQGAWVVGQLDGLLYRIEGGRVVQRVKLSETAGVIARSGSNLWVSAGPTDGRHEIVRVNAEDGKVTGRVSVGLHIPQAIVPIGKQLWVITSAGELLRVSPE